MTGASVYTSVHISSSRIRQHTLSQLQTVLCKQTLKQLRTVLNNKNGTVHLTSPFDSIAACHKGVCSITSPNVCLHCCWVPRLVARLLLRQWLHLHSIVSICWGAFDWVPFCCSRVVTARIVSSWDSRVVSSCYPCSLWVGLVCVGVPLRVCSVGALQTLVGICCTHGYSIVCLQ